MLVNSESECAEEAGAKWRAQDPCSNSAEPEEEGGLVAICVSQPVNHVCTPPGQDVFQDFFQYRIHLTLTLFMQNVKRVLFSFCLYTFAYVKSLQNYF